MELTVQTSKVLKTKIIPSNSTASAAAKAVDRCSARVKVNGAPACGNLAIAVLHGFFFEAAQRRSKPVLWV